MPSGVAVDPSGNVFIVDCNNRIRKVTADGIISTFTQVTWGFCGFGYFGPLTVAGGAGIASDKYGNLFVADRLQHTVYKVTPDGQRSSIAGSGLSGFSGDGGPARQARLSSPWGIAVDAADNVYIADTGNYRVRKVTPAGIISTVAGGDGGPGFSTDGVATAVNIHPMGVAVDVDGNLLIADSGLSVIRKVTAGIITTIAGTGVAGFGGDSGPAPLAHLDTPMGLTTDEAGNIYIADTNNHRIRRLEKTAPLLTRLSPNFAGPGMTVNIAFYGANFFGSPGINAGPDVTVTDVAISSENVVTATLRVEPGATPGVRNVTLTNDLGATNPVAFNIGDPFPDLSVDAAHGLMAVGFEGQLHVKIDNIGSLATSGAITLTEVLPTGLLFVAASGDGWSCSAVGQTVTCLTSQPLAPGDSAALTLSVAVDDRAPTTLFHSPSIETSGDLGVSNNSTSDPVVLFSPEPYLSFSGAVTEPARLADVSVSLQRPFPRDLKGILRLEFKSTAVFPVDDPAIQFITGGREIDFTIPANSTIAQFGNAGGGLSVGFQPGTVAGKLEFTATLQSGTVEKVFADSRVIHARVPIIKSITFAGGVLDATILSTPREITHLHLQFNTTPHVRLSCGESAVCTVYGNVFILDVKSMFDSWFRGDSTFGSLSLIRLPLTIEGSLRGTISVTARNSIGQSSRVEVPLP
jgi:sugar lactone lactonase YvrE